MIRTLVTPKTDTVSFSIPKEYIGKEVEIIAFATSEGINSGGNTAKTVSFTAASVDTKAYKFNRDEANER